MTCVIGTRGSALALWQANAVKRAILAAAPEEQVEVRVVSTKGDRVLDEPLELIGGKGLFTGELESALVAGDVDLCVHSMKDVPTELALGCVIGAMLPRADVRDVLVCGPRIEARSLAEVPRGARLGTGSLRRSAQLRSLHPHIEPKPVRGNVDTRLGKAAGPDYEGVILAAAGVERMGELGRVSCWIPVDEMLPAAGQGAIGVEVRADDASIAEICAAIDDVPTSTCVGIDVGKKGFERLPLYGLRVLIPRAQEAREALPGLLRDAGARVDVVAAYQTVAPADARADELAEILETGEVDFVTFTSPSTARNLVALLGDRRGLLANAGLASIGPVTSAALRELGFEPSVEARPYTSDGLVDALVAGRASKRGEGDRT